MTRIIWFSSPNYGLLELLAQTGLRHILIDLEHGSFDLPTSDRFILCAKSMGLTVHAKTLSPDMAPVQQMLDFGADSVVIPHIEGVAHAREVCAYAKFPPVGKRSCSGGRTFHYGPATPDAFASQNRNTRCYPMIETAGACTDIASILALDTVDGVFVGPTDLALSQGRASYTFGPEDLQNIRRIAQAANAAGKPWIMPAWRSEEQELSRTLGVAMMVTAHEQGIMAAGLKQLTGPV